MAEQPQAPPPHVAAIRRKALARRQAAREAAQREAESDA
jgi:hypothetical protein